MPITPTLAIAIAIDLMAVAILAGPLYFRRHRRRDLMLSYVALNVGVLGVAIALSGSEVGVGLGLGLFGVLSIVRLRSDQISQAEIAYYFTALALGLLAGLGGSSIWLPLIFSALLLSVLYVVDHPSLLSAQRRRSVTLDRAYLNEWELRGALAQLLDGKITRLEVLQTDLVRDTTVVDVRFRISANSPATGAGVSDQQHGVVAGPVQVPPPFSSPISTQPISSTNAQPTDSPANARPVGERVNGNQYAAG